MEGSLRSKIDWAIAYSWKEIYRYYLFYLVFGGNFQVQASAGAYTRRGDLPEGFLRYRFGGGLYLEGLYIYGSCIALHCKSEKYFYMNTLLNDSCYHCIIKKIVL